MIKPFYFLVLLMLLTPGAIGAQEYLQWIRQVEEGATFDEIRQKAELYYQDREQGRGSGYRQYKRWEYLMQNRLDENGSPVNFGRMIWDVSKDLFPQTKKTDAENDEGCQANWTLLTPLDGYITSPGGYNPGLGRVNVVAFHPSDPNVIYAGTPAGGLWKSPNQGGAWIPLTDHLPSIGVSGIAIHPDNPDHIYILTGDGDGANTYCIGVLKSTDGGQNWVETGLVFAVNELVRGYKLVMYPGNPDIMMVVASQGIYRTTNGGATWTNAVAGTFVDIEFNPSNPSIVYASTNNLFYRSANGGASWTIVSSGLTTGENRIALAVSPANPDYVYALAGPSNDDGFFKGLFRSVDSGLSFSTQATAPNILGYAISGGDNSSQSSYDLALAVAPDDAETLIAGGINVWRSESGGVAFDISSHWYYPNLPSNGLQYTHADIHELTYHPLDGSLWCGSDGGIFVSYDDGKTWEDRSSLGASGLSIMQFYRIASYAGNPHIIIGGTQDNGSNRWDGGDNIRHFDGADGMDCMIHPTDSMIQYHTRQNGSLRKSLDGGESHSNIRPGASSGYWVTPLAMDPVNPDIIYAAYQDTVYRSADGGENWVGSIPQLSVGRYRSLHVAPADPAVIYVATDLRMFVTVNTGGTWTEITAGLPASASSRITRIVTDADNASKVWVTMGGFVAANKVFYSENAGADWQNATGGLPNLPVNCIVYDAQETGGDNAVYIGMDVGVFFRDASLNDWIPYINGLPNVPVFDLEIHASSGMLQAGTFGRGIWETPLYQPDQANPTIACPGLQTVSLDANCAIALPDFSVQAFFSDNCDPSPTVVQSPAPGTIIYEDAILTLTVSDWEGNLDSCQLEVLLIDNSPPVFTCPEDIVLYTCEEAIVEYQVSWADNCSEAVGSLTEGLPGGSVFPVGATAVTWTASDTLGNVAVCTFLVTVIDSVALNLAVQASCPNDSTGGAEASALSGVAPYTYAWNDPQAQTGAVAIGLAPGAYSVWVVDSAGCTGMASLVIEQSPEVLITVDTVKNESSSQANGFIAVTIAGGIPPYQYLWRLDGEVFDNQEDLSGLTAGIYALEITDANGCTYVSELILVDNLTSVGEAAALGYDFVLLPNPASEEINVMLESFTGRPVTLRVWNALGQAIQEVYTGALPSAIQVVDLRPFGSGIYYMELQSEEIRLVKKFVVAKQ